MVFQAIYIHTHAHKTWLNRVVDETTRGYGLGGETTRWEMVSGVKRLIEKNRGKTTRGENVLAKRLVTISGASGPCVGENQPGTRNGSCGKLGQPVHREQESRQGKWIFVIKRRRVKTEYHGKK